ncbi:MAG: 30S ribosomal protein S21, partial [Eubacterium sp.]|nr:30S ribosomal protein S21 [Eubacterium sp.]
SSLVYCGGSAGVLYLNIHACRKIVHYEKPSVARKKKSEAARKRKYK